MPDDKPPLDQTGDTASPKMVDFYFDFVSPFGFFASLRINSLAQRYGYQVRWHSMLIGVSVIKVMGMKPLLETPLKGAYIIIDAERYARRHGIRLGRAINDPIVDPRPAGKAFNWLSRYRPERAEDFAQAVFAAYWLHGKDISQHEMLEELLWNLHLADAEVLAEITGDEAGQLLRDSVSRSLERGAFGSPFFLVGNEPFFGVEKMELLENWLQSGGW